MSDTNDQAQSPTPNEPPFDAQAKIDAFVGAVDAAMTKANVPERERQNVMDDLRAQIADMLAERGHGAALTPADVEAVLGELDPPESYAAEREPEMAGVGAPHEQAEEPRRSWKQHGCGGRGRRRWWGKWRHHREIAAAIKHAVLWHGPMRGPWFAGLTPRALQAIQLAKLEARRMNHSYIGTEHMVIGLLVESSGVASAVMKELGVKLDALRAEVERLVQPGTEPSTAPKLPLTPRASQALEEGSALARQLGHDYVGTEHVLIGVISVPGVAAIALQGIGVKLDQLRAALMAKMGATDPAGNSPSPVETKSTAPTFWPPGTGRTVNLAGDTWTFIATGAETGGAYSMFELMIPPGSTSPKTVNRREDTAFYIVAGQLKLTVGDRTIDAKAGAFVNVPKGTAHFVKNDSTDAAKVLVTTTPAGMERFLSEVASLSAPIDSQQLAAIAEKHGIELR